MAIKILFADDEYWIRQKFSHMIDWEEQGFDFLTPVKNGEEAYASLEQNRPDILLTDINMPFLSGNELVHRLKTDYPDIIPIIISGYDDFSYVHDTLLDGAIEYLLKPVTAEKLLSVLEKASALIQKREQQWQKNHLQSAALKKDESLMQDMVYSKLLLCPSGTSEESSGSTKIIHRNSIFLLKVHGMQHNSSANSAPFPKEVKNELSVHFSSVNSIFFQNMLCLDEFIVISDLSGLEFHHIASECMDAMKKLTSLSLTGVVLLNSCTSDTLQTNYVTIKTYLRMRPYTPQNKLLVQTMMPTSCVPTQSICSTEVLAELRLLVRSHKRNLLESFIMELLGFTPGSLPRSVYTQQQTLRGILGLFGELSEKGEILPIPDIVFLTDVADNLIESLEQDTVKSFIQELLDEAEGPDAGISSSIQNIVRDVALYVDGNYAGEITLSSLAERFNVSPTYLSRAFSKQTGKTLVSYLTHCRIEKAAEYILNTEESFCDIAQIVGYNDYAYFNRVFRKIIGMNPSDYRLQLSNKRSQV